jgi:hypothetical protein
MVLWMSVPPDAEAVEEERDECDDVVADEGTGGRAPACWGSSWRTSAWLSRVTLSWKLLRARAL